MKTRLRLSMVAEVLLGATIVALLLAGCGSKAASGPGGVAPPPPGGGTSGPSPLSMTVDGQPWSADPLAPGGGVNVSVPGTYILVAFRGVGTAATGVTFTLTNIGGPGTYDLGVSATNFGGGLLFANATGSWWTSPSGAAGSVTITTLTSTRIAGTFACTLDALTGDAQGPLTITNGSFDFPIVSNTAGSLPANAGSRLSATVDGAAWNAAYIVTFRSGVADSLISCGASNLAGGLGLGVKGATAPGTYSIESGASTLIFLDASKVPKWGGTGRDSGAIVITSISPSRIKGTFSGRLGARSGSGAFIQIVGGTFDVGIQATAGPAPDPASMRRAAINAAESMRRVLRPQP